MVCWDWVGSSCRCPACNVTVTERQLIPLRWQKCPDSISSALGRKNIGAQLIFLRLKKCRAWFSVLHFSFLGLQGDLFNKQTCRMFSLLIERIHHLITTSIIISLSNRSVLTLISIRSICDVDKEWRRGERCRSMRCGAIEEFQRLANEQILKYIIEQSSLLKILEKWKLKSVGHIWRQREASGWIL